MKFTEKAVAALDLPAGVNERLFTDSELTGLSLRLRRGASGITRSWVYRYSVAGTHRKVTFDFVGHNLAAARKRAGDLQARVRLGQDPAQDRAQTQADVRQTIEATLHDFLPEKRLTLRPSSYRQIERHLLRYLKPLHRTPLRLVTPGDVAKRHLEIATASGRPTATNALRSWSNFFGWCLRKGFIEKNPAIGVERFKHRERERVLNASEIKMIWDATSDATDYSAVVRLLLLTGCRANEIGGLKWSEVYSDRIVLPAERVKNKLQHVIPITTTVRTILLEGRERRPGKEHVFGRQGDRPLTGWGRCKASLDARLRAADVAIEKWVVHDLRRTAATGMGELGIAPHVIEAVLNHVSGFRSGVAGTYNRAQLEGPMRHALNVWDAHVRDIVEGRTAGDRVVPLRG
jgi:integrase